MLEGTLETQGALNSTYLLYNSENLSYAIKLVMLLKDLGPQIRTFKQETLLRGQP